MSEYEISITGQDGDYFLIEDAEKGYKGKIDQFLVQANELEIVNNKISMNETLYNAWFKEDLELTARKEAAEYAKKHAYKFFVQFDYPVNEEGQGVSAEFFSKNEETAKAEAMEVYNDQFGEEASGKIIKFVRYRWASEVRQFCIEKYGTAYPTKIECGKIEWWNVPYFAMPYSPMEMKGVPYLVIEEIAKEKEKLRKILDEYQEKYPMLNGKMVILPGLPKEKMDKFLEKHPERIPFIKPVEEWRKVYWKLLSEMTDLKDVKPLTPGQLELLGINFDPYKHEYQGGKAYIGLKGKRMEIAPEFGKIV